ncbi:MAG: helix-hairpin-helix domain-containing protein [Proteobacteria bacterium]|nr:helix-hairpin-helix domain-containing protein [Pseudomonadota bacterium]
MTNTEIAELFEEMADLLELENQNRFRIRAYRNAARVIQNWPIALTKMIEDPECKLREIFLNLKN